MDEIDNTLTARTNEMKILISQIGDPQAKYDAGIIDDAERIEQLARRRAYMQVLAAAERGELVDDDALDVVLEQARVDVAQPSQEEINAAKIDYLLMIGGEL